MLERLDFRFLELYLEKYHGTALQMQESDAFSHIESTALDAASLHDDFLVRAVVMVDKTNVE